MAAVLLFVTVLVILSVCQSQNSGFIPKKPDIDYNSKETITKSTESIISFGGMTQKEKISEPQNETVTTPNGTACPITQLETKGPVNLYIHGAFATTNKGRCVTIVVCYTLKLSGSLRFEFCFVLLAAEGAVD